MPAGIIVPARLRSGVSSGASIEVIQTDYYDTSGNETTYSFSMDIGTAEAGRKVIIMTNAENVNSPWVGINSVTVNSVSATEIHEQEYTTTIQLICGIWVADVPTGTGNVSCSVTLSGLVNSFSAYSIAIRNCKSSTETFAGGGNSSSRLPTVWNCTCEAGGILVGQSILNVPPETCTWDSELTERRDSGTGEHEYSFAYTLYENALSATNITADWTGSGNMSVAQVAALR